MSSLMSSLKNFLSAERGQLVGLLFIIIVFAVIIIFTNGCGGSNPVAIDDGGALWSDGGGTTNDDGGIHDGGQAQTGEDGGVVSQDGGSVNDGGLINDGGLAIDGGRVDAGVPDAGCPAQNCDDSITCTDDRIDSYTCQCEHIALHGRCPQGQICFPEQCHGCCGRPACATASQCPDPHDPCIVITCEESTATCRYDPLDRDGDGHPPKVCLSVGGDDCDDSNPNVHPGATEACNNQDDNCDGITDDGMTRPCSTACGRGTETCDNGEWVNCGENITEEITRPCSTACGSGTETCVHGWWVNCTAPRPSGESCDGIDNNCNGRTDEGFWPNVGEPCTMGVGACKRTGISVCRANHSGTECSVQAIIPKKVDILVVMDNSGSMNQRQFNIVQNLSSSLLGHLNSVSADFQLAVITTDMSWENCMYFRNETFCIRVLNSNNIKQSYNQTINGPFGSGRFEAYDSNPKCLNNSTNNLSTVLEQNLFVGTSGDHFAKGMEAMKRALEFAKDGINGNDCNGPHGGSFLRPNAMLAVIIISDGDDCSHDPDTCEQNGFCEIYGSECRRFWSYLYPLERYETFLKGLKTFDGGYQEGSIGFIAAVGPNIPYPSSTCEEQPCPGTSECIGGACFPKCQSNSECPADGGVCSNGSCQPYPPNTYYSCNNLGNAEPGARYIDMVKTFDPSGIFQSICRNNMDRVGVGVTRLLCTY